MAYKKPMQRSLVLGCVSFILCLCVALSALSWFVFSAALYQRYNQKLENVLTFVEHQTDAVDLDRCINTGVTSVKYAALQELLNGMVDDFQLMYLYIIIPLDTQTGTMMNVISATSAAEFAAGEDNLPLLMISDAYPKEEVDHYLAAWNVPEVTYFEEKSDYGHCYTACQPLRLPDGRTIALVCADVDINSLHQNVWRYVIISLALTITVGMAFGSLLLLWLRRNVTGPVLALEKSALSFAEKSHDAHDPSQLSYDAPEIHTLNEVESLADAIAQMSEDIKTYIQDVLSAECQVRDAEKEVEGISRIAYQDPLTQVKSKAAYNEKLSELEASAKHGTDPFAVIMVDMNNLKKINDTYGHQNGDRYIVGASKIVSNVFKHSPVFRVGGDEFVVLLQGEDYEHRGILFQHMEEQFQEASAAEDRAPWERYSAAAGLAVWAPGESPSETIRRADDLMYRNKQRMKAGRDFM